MDEAQFWFQQASGPQIGNSLRFRGAQYLGKVNPIRAAYPTKATISMWLKRGSLSTLQYVAEGIYNDKYRQTIELSSANNLAASFSYEPTFAATPARSTFRDTGGWTHIVFTIDTTVSPHIANLYINGAIESSVSHATYIACYMFGGTAATSTVFGRSLSSFGTLYFDGYMAEIIGVEGQVLGPTSFGEKDPNGVWRPKKYTGTYGTKGFHLDFSDAANIGKDSSGNGNDFTAVGFQLTNPTAVDYDWTTDSPFNNYSTLNPLIPGHSALTHANLATTGTILQPTIDPGFGNWYYEVNGGGNHWNGLLSSWVPRTGHYNFGQMPWSHPALASGNKALRAGNLHSALPTTITGTFTGNGSADGPFVYTGCIPGRIQYGTVDVTYGNRLTNNDVDFLCNGFKVRSAVSNSGTVNYTVTTTHSDGEHSGRQVPFGGAGRSPATACSN